MISLVAMGTVMDEDVSWFSGCLICARVCESLYASECTYTVYIHIAMCMCSHKEGIACVSEEHILLPLNFSERILYLVAQ